MRSVLPDGRAYCGVGDHPIGDGAWVYTVNPDGGYGRSELLCCARCIRRAENMEIRLRMIECSGAKELMTKASKMVLESRR